MYLTEFIEFDLIYQLIVFFKLITFTETYYNFLRLKLNIKFYLRCPTFFLLSKSMLNIT